jgi:glycosyltransferase involved in cell wall biosynthesis
MRILHTESSNGYGGQEIRILKEMQKMREDGHELILAVEKGGGLVARARQLGFLVYEIGFKKYKAPWTLLQLVKIISKHQIEIINTHSSMDGWLGGIAGRIARKKVVRTRHLSTPVRAGLNSYLLYNKLCDRLVTTSSAVIETIAAQSLIAKERCACIPTGVCPEEIAVDWEKVSQFRASLGLKEDDFLVGTLCFVRSWKGIPDFMRAANLLRGMKNLKWVIIGGGYVDNYKGLAKELELQDILYFTGHLNVPFDALAALDVFLLLSTAHEGISQASLQAAYLQRPLITTSVGGLPEVCIEGKTGFLVPPHAPEAVAERLKALLLNKELRKELGANGKALVEARFTMEQTLSAMLKIYKGLL